jgi:MFS family permease
MTSLCAATTSFTQLALARVGVGVGEAGGSPPALSLISSYFNRGHRATAMGVYSLGPTVGILLGFVVGGWVNAQYGWRAAMLAAGLPGLLLAVLVKLTIPEPRSVPGGGEQLTDALPPFWTTVRTLFRIPAFALLNAATVAAGISLYGFMVWVPVYLIREFALTTREVGTVVGLCAGFAGSLGVFSGGWLADRLSRRNYRWQLRVPGLTTLVFCPLVLLVINAGSKQTAFLLLVPTYMFALAYTGASWAVLQSIVPANMRAVAAAILLFLVNLIGLALGPQLVGLLSDIFQRTAAGAGGLRIAITIVCAGSLFATLFFYLGSRSLEAEPAAAR